MWFRRISFICVPQAADSFYLVEVPGELLLMQGTVLSGSYLFSAAEVLRNYVVVTAVGNWPVLFWLTF